MTGVLAKCRLCPHLCGVNRLQGQEGFCRSGDLATVFRHGPHHGEEPPVSGTRGSGTVFFSRCTMKCLYCQNHPWSQDGQGTAYTVDQLAAILNGLAEAGCHNWNLVSPTPWIPLVEDALTIAKRNGSSLPTVYNSSGYERAEIIARLTELVDIYLVDLRYSTDESALAGSGVEHYVDNARSAILEMWRQKGPLECDHDGIAASGTICRLLILPGLAQELVTNLHWLAETVGREIAVSVMAQYLPLHKATTTSPWDRRIAAAEYALVSDTLSGLDFRHGWIQEFEIAAPHDMVGRNMTGDSEVCFNVQGREVP